MGGKFFFRPNLQEQCVNAPPGHEMHPQPEQESIFRTVFAGWLRFGGIFRRRRSLRATSKKGRQLFWQKSAPLRQNPGYAYVKDVVNGSLRQLMNAGCAAKTVRSLENACHT